MLEDLNAEDKLIAAKIRLVLNQPFFGNIAPRLILQERKDIPVAATDGIHFFYNKEAIEKLTISETVWLMGHEVGHVIFFHFDRMEGRNHNLWNCACDFAINIILKKNNIGTPIKDCLYDRKYDDKCAEEIYDLLKKEYTTLDSINQLVQRIVDTHIPLGKDKDGKDMSQEEIDSLKNDIKESIISAFQTCSAGEVPFGIDRLIESLTKPKLSWRDVIRQTIQSKIKYDFTFQRANKRSWHTGIYLPSMNVEDEIDLAIAFDMSGSISDEGASAFLSEINGIITDFNSWNIKLWSFDTRVYNFKEYSCYSDDSILQYKPKGGGGTDFECNWSFMKTNSIQPKLFIMFTDMYPCGGWGDANYCDTLFVSYGNKTTIAPFGETVNI